MGTSYSCQEIPDKIFGLPRTALIIFSNRIAQMIRVNKISLESNPAKSSACLQTKEHDITEKSLKLFWYVGEWLPFIYPLELEFKETTFKTFTSNLKTVVI